MNEVVEWLKVLVRWTHVFAAILWIGNTYLFNFMEKSLERDADTPDDVKGRLWMVHGGGFYFVEKQKVLKGKPRILHWFKWEAAGTWLSGAALISLDYYYGGLLVEPEMSYSRGVVAGLATIVGGWFVYDLLVQSPLGKNELVLAAIGWLAFVGITFVLGGYLSPRAVLIHVGAMIGTIMAANVWLRILPAQKKMLASIEGGRMPEASTAATGPLRSKQNSYMVIPLVLLMISNHFPRIYGSRYVWAILGAATIAGWIVARMFRGGTKPGEGAPAASTAKQAGPGPAWHAALALALLVAGLGVGSRYARARAAEPDAPSHPPATGTGKAQAKMAPTGKAVIEGEVTFEGTVPPPEDWGGARNAECGTLHPATIQLVRVESGKLADVFVYVSGGLPEGSYPTPKAPVEFDQKGCEFTPRVFGVVAGQDVEIGNGDKMLHNVHTPGFNQAFPVGVKLTKSLDDPQVMATIKCDVHPWMRAYAGVMEHPYFAVTGANGAFSIPGLPDGTYELGAWHEKLGTMTAKATATEAAPGKVSIVFRK